MKSFLMLAVALAVTAGAFQATAEAAAARRVFKDYAKTNISRSAADEHQPRTRGDYVKPSYLQGSHKALGMC